MHKSSAEAIVSYAYFHNIKVLSVSCSAYTSRACGLEVTGQICKDTTNYFGLVQKIQESIVNSLTHRFLSKFPIIFLYIFFVFLMFCSLHVQRWQDYGSNRHCSLHLNLVVIWWCGKCSPDVMLAWSSVYIIKPL